jgi:hypothetical protein
VVGLDGALRLQKAQFSWRRPNGKPRRGLEVDAPELVLVCVEYVMGVLLQGEVVEQLGEPVLVGGHVLDDVLGASRVVGEVDLARCLAAILEMFRNWLLVEGGEVEVLSLGAIEYCLVLWPVVGDALFLGHGCVGLQA